MNDYFNELLNVNRTIFKKYFQVFDFPWILLKDLKTYIKFYEKTLSSDFNEISEGVFAHKTAKIDKTAKIYAPTIIDENAEIRHSAFLRGGCVIGKNCVVGNSSEIKNSVLFDEVKIPHFNYVGDSVLGYAVHFGAGVITSNVKLDKKHVYVSVGNEKYDTGLTKLGAIVGDNTEIGCNCVLNPATVIGKNCRVYPLNSLRGEIKSNIVYKDKYDIVFKE